MKNSERKDLIARMVAMARTCRQAAKKMAFHREETRGEAMGYMRAARMLKGYATQARFAWDARRAA